MVVGFYIATSNSLIRNFFKFLISFVSERATDILKLIKTYTIEDLDELYMEKMKLMKDINNMIDEMKLDAFICPGFPLPAYLNNEC